MLPVNRRSLLFVPGSRPERFAKALTSGADLVCVDLEDAVAPGDKDGARAPGVAFLCDAPGTRRVLRINSPRSATGLRDLLAVIEARPSGGALFLPKVDHPQEIAWVAGLIEEAGLDLTIGVLIESLAGLENVGAILAAHPRLVFAMFGGADLSAELGVGLADRPLLYARSRVVHAAKLAGIDVLDVPCLDFRSADSVRAETKAAIELGFTGKGALHPDNVPIVNQCFVPEPAQVERARKVMAAFEASRGGVTVLDGKLVERPVVLAMQRILAAAQSNHEIKVTRPYIQHHSSRD